MAVTVGRGVAFIGAAKLYFILASSAIELALPRILGPFVYGAYGFVAQSVSTLNNVVVTGTIQAVSRQLSADPTRADAVKATGFRLHLFVGLPLALLFCAAAPLVAHFAHDASKTAPLALSAAVVAGYAFYAVLVGAANGARQFHKQAGLDVCFATLRVVAIVGTAALGLGVTWVIGGWVVAVAVILVVALFWVGGPRGARAEPVAPMARFLAGVAFYLVLVNLLLVADMFLLKRLTFEQLQATGSLPVDAARLADGRVGYYRVVQQLARLPYQLMIAVTFVVFPLVSQATFANDRERTREYVRTTMRYSLIFATLIGIVLAVNPASLIDIPFTSDYVIIGGPALTALALGHVALAIFTIGGTILNGAGRTRDAIITAAVTLAATTGGILVLLPRATGDAEALLACAVATGGGMVLGAALTGAMLVRHIGAFLGVKTVARVALAAGAAWAVASVVPATRPVATLAEAALVAAVFLAALVATGELGRAELALVQRVVRRRS